MRTADTCPGHPRKFGDRYGGAISLGDTADDWFYFLVILGVAAIVVVFIVIIIVSIAKSVV